MAASFLFLKVVKNRITLMPFDRFELMEKVETLDVIGFCIPYTKCSESH